MRVRVRVRLPKHGRTIPLGHSHSQCRCARSHAEFRPPADQRLARSLATQQRDQLTQRAVLESVEEVYRSALLTLEALPFDMTTVPIERGRSALTPDVQRPFRDFMQSLLDDVVAFNRTSCALSNFPDEHHLSKEYTQTILRDIAAAWQEFSLSANRLLLAKAQPSSVRRPRGQVTGISA